MTSKVTALFYDDGAHGWLRVPRAVIDKLGISNKISEYSYQKDGVVYLEEDGDMAIFLRAMAESGLQVIKERKHIIDPETNFIRKLPSYNGLT